MKLRNKLTGEINILKVNEDYFNIYKDDGEFVCPVTLKELNEGWEDCYEEPKEYWRIDCDGTLSHGRDDFDTPFDNACKEIGNYFESKEEAEQAVEKLKAWKRLKDKGFRFTQQPFDLSFHTVHFTLDGQYKYTDETAKDIDLIFGGKNGE